MTHNTTRRYIIAGQHVAPAKVKAAKDLRRNMTEAERLLWAAVRGNRLDGRHFRRQQVIDGFVVDFYCHSAGLVVEIDGPVHDGRVEYDAERSHVLEARGLRVLRLGNEDVLDRLGTVLARIREACSCHLTPQPPSQPGKGESPLSGSERGWG